MLALLPLDDRPCNFRFPAEIAAIGGAHVIAPPREWLGHFNAPGNADELQIWLENLPEVECLIVSVDMLAYGGLVASRKTATSLETAFSRLQILGKWRQNRPATPIYAFNILMRLAITMDSDAAVPHYYNVMRFARLTDEAARFPSPAKTAELEAVRAQIPPAILDEYCAARARNHAVNLAMVESLSRGIFDYLLITQEDCTQFGLHRREQDEITSRARELGVENRFALHPGADEAALTLLARHFQTGISFGIEWSDEAHKRDIAVFEDVPYEDALHSHIAAMGGQIASQNPDCLLFVNAPVGGSQKEETLEAKTARAAQVSEFCNRIEAALSQNIPVALCDVAFPNGADDLLLSQLEKRGVLGKLSAFGGWNTAGNTTGTVLAQCAALFHSQNDSKNDEKAQNLNQKFTFERLVDDWGYQARVRAQIEATARERGFSPLNMNGQAKGIEAIARRELREFAGEIAPQFGVKVEKLEVALPWGRTFEVEVGAKLS